MALQLAAIGGIYVLKVLRRSEAVREELRNPVKLNFFATMSISLVLLAIASTPFWPGPAEGLWMAGAGLHLLFTLYVLNIWMHRSDFEPHHMNPAWFIPVVGNVLVPVAGAVDDACQPMSCSGRCFSWHCSWRPSGASMS